VKDAADASANALNLVQQYAAVRSTIVGKGGLLDAYETQLTDITTLIENLSNLNNTAINLNHTNTYQYKVDSTAFD